MSIQRFSVVSVAVGCLAGEETSISYILKLYPWVHFAVVFIILAHLDNAGGDDGGIPEVYAKNWQARLNETLQSPGNK